MHSRSATIPNGDWLTVLYLALPHRVGLQQVVTKINNVLEFNFWLCREYSLQIQFIQLQPVVEEQIRSLPKSSKSSTLESDLHVLSCFPGIHRNRLSPKAGFIQQQTNKWFVQSHTNSTDQDKQQSNKYTWRQGNFLTKFSVVMDKRIAIAGSPLGRKGYPLLISGWCQSIYHVQEKCVSQQVQLIKSNLNPLEQFKGSLLSDKPGHGDSILEEVQSLPSSSCRREAVIPCGEAITHTNVLCQRQRQFVSGRGWLIQSCQASSIDA